MNSVVQTSEHVEQRKRRCDESEGMMSEQKKTDVLDDVLATLASQDRDIRSVTLEEAKALTFQIIARREVEKRQSSARTLHN